MAGTQNIFRKLATLVKVPDTMVFTGAKVLSSVVATVVFFLLKRSVC
jgi:hypothetical protein